METMSLIGYKTMLAWYCAQSRLDSRLEFGFQLEASQSPIMLGCDIRPEGGYLKGDEKEESSHSHSH